MEISRFGNSAHVWIFFSDSVPACETRQLGAALISQTCNRVRRLSLSSYDRLFPNQDTRSKGGFGNLIARLYCYKTDPRTSDILPVLKYGHDHCIDALRYAVEEIWNKSGGRVAEWSASDLGL